MSRYEAYSDYKDSGVEWLGTIPSHWEISPLKYLVRFSGGGTPSKDNPEFWNGDIPWVSPKDMKIRRVVATIDNVTESAIKQSSTNLLEKGALLMVVRSGILRHSIPVAINDVTVSLNQDMKALRFADPLVSEYAYYFVTGNQSSLLLEWSKEGATVESIEHEYLAGTLFPCPPLKDRTTIINFLDHETAKIDALIEKQQRLIELLKEKRQAVISHAVTKGLNPNAPMKDSGVEWLGEVPAHWGMTKFHYEIDLLEGPGILANDFHDEGVPLLRIQNVKDEFVSRDYKTYLSPSKVRAKWEHFRVAQGDLIISCSATTGLVSEVGEDTAGAVPYTGLIRLRPQVKASITKEFIRCLVQSDLFFEQIKLLQSGSTIQHFGPYHLQQMHITLPALTEQNEIAKAVKEKKARLDKLISIADQQIELMQERRTALISAAVTGKIDVRNWQAAA